MSRPAYTYKTAAEWLNIKPDKLRRLVERREITHVKLGREVRFRLIDLEEYVSDRIRPAKHLATSLRAPPV